MNNINKVTSLELSKKIHDKAIEKGFELPESEYSWIIDNTTGERNLIKSNKPFDVFECEVYSYYRAYDTAELGEILDGYDVGKALTGWRCDDGGGDRYVCHFPFELLPLLDLSDKEKREYYETYPPQEAKTMADAMGKMFYYLLDNDLL